MGHQEAASTVPASEAETVILVLQKSLRSTLHRAAAAENQVEKPPGELHYGNVGVRIRTEPPPIIPPHPNSTQWGLVSIALDCQAGKGNLMQLGGPAGALGISIWWVCHRQHGIMIMMITMRLICIITSQPQLQIKTPPRRPSSPRRSSRICM